MIFEALREICAACFQSGWGGGLGAVLFEFIGHFGTLKVLYVSSLAFRHIKSLNLLVVENNLNRCEPPAIATIGRMYWCCRLG